MRKQLTNKGFSLVELLAVIVILGILGVISIAAVNLVLDKAEKKHYETQQKNLLMAAKSYSQDNRNVLPKKVGETRIVTLEELQNAKYVGKILDRNKKECTTGSVTIYKYSNNDYSYRAYLKCPNWETGKNDNDEDDYGGSGPEITLTLNTNYEDPNFTYNVTTTGDAKIISYSYQIYKHGVLIKDSGSIPVSKISSIEEKKVSLKEVVPGEFEIVFKASDIYGKTNTAKANGTIKTENGPQCGEVYPVLNSWTNEPVSINVTCVDTTGAGCTKEVFSQIFTADSKTNYIEISDKLGNKTTCQIDTYTDSTAPSKPIITNPYENTWINKSYSISVVSMDKTSGIAYFEYRYPNSSVSSERNWVKYANSNKAPGDNSVFTTPNFSKERNEAVEIRACDYAGNCSEATRSIIKIDKTKPTCSITRNIASPNGQNSWYISNVNLTLNTNDTGSGVNAKDLTASPSATYAGKTTVTQGNTNGITYYGYVRDAAGNTGSCTSGSFKIDTAPPTCSITRNIVSPNGQNSWYISNVNLTLNTNDTGSGLNAKDLTTSPSATYAGKTTATQGDTAGVNYYGYVRDAAGNIGNCVSGSFKVDTTPPTCSIQKTGTGGSGGVYTSQVSLQLNVDDTGSIKSGVSYGLANNSTVTYNNISTGTQGATNGIIWHGFVIDNAGNANSCNTGNFKVLLNPPIITFSLSGKTSTATCTDANTGGNIPMTNATKVLSQSSLTHTVTCTDTFGNSSTLSKTYKYDACLTKNITCHQGCGTCHAYSSSYVCDTYVSGIGTACGGITNCANCHRPIVPYDCNCDDCYTKTETCVEGFTE